MSQGAQAPGQFGARGGGIIAGAQRQPGRNVDYGMGNNGPSIPSNLPPVVGGGAGAQAPGSTQGSGQTGIPNFGNVQGNGNGYQPPTSGQQTPGGVVTNGPGGLSFALPHLGVAAGPSSPYTNAAAQTGQASQAAVNQQTQANRVGQTNPFASQGWSQDANGQWHENTSFAPGMQGMMNTLQGQWAQGPGAFQTAAYDQAKSRLDPQFQQGQEQLDTQLANQGLAPGSAAYKTAEDQFSRNRNDAYSSAFNQSFNNGLAAQQSNFNQLQGMQGFLSMPGFNAAGQAQAPNYLGALALGNNYNLALQGFNNGVSADQMAGAAQMVNSGVGLMQPFASAAAGGGGQTYSI